MRFIGPINKCSHKIQLKNARDLLCDAVYPCGNCTQSLCETLDRRIESISVTYFGRTESTEAICEGAEEKFEIGNHPTEFLAGLNDLFQLRNERYW